MLEDQARCLRRYHSTPRQNYEPLLPEVDAQFRELDARMRVRLEQRQTPRPNALQTILTARARLSGDWAEQTARRELSHASRSGSAT